MPPSNKHSTLKALTLNALIRENATPTLKCRVTAMSDLRRDHVLIYELVSGEFSLKGGSQSKIYDLYDLHDL